MCPALTWWRLPLLFVFSALSFPLLPLHAGPPKDLLSSHLPKAQATAPLVGSLPTDRRLNLGIGLPLRDPAVLEAFLSDLYDPASPRYRQFLTTSEFTEQFGPAESDYQLLVSWAKDNHFDITAQHPNRMLLSVNASVGDIERALHINLQVYSHPHEARTFYAPDREPTSDLPISVLHISGLDNYVIPRPAVVRPPRDTTTTNSEPLGGSGPGGTYRGNDFRGAYARSVSLTGSNQMVGLFELDGFYPNDITNYAVTTGIRLVPTQTVLMDGMDGSAGLNNIEVALDIQMAMAMAPGLSQIIVYEGLDVNNILNRMATDNLAKQLSASWLYPVDSTTLQIFRQFAAQGQTYFTASGDDGAYAPGIGRPTDDPYVTSVGGTTLSTTGPGGVWTAETTWNWASSGRAAQGTGGGISLTNPIPSWQQGISMTANKGSTTRRNSPDVAMTADAIWIIYDNGTSGSVGGTSASAPLWAGFTALINEQAAGLAKPPIGFINPAIYALGKSAGYSTNFHDITTGNNTNTSSPTLFYATAGYDLCTGWGSPVGLNLINSLVPRDPGPVLTNSGSSIVSEGCAPGNGVVDPGETVTVNFTLKNIGGIKTTNLVATLLTSTNVLAPSSSQTYGSLAGSGGSATRAFSFTAGGSCGGILTATLSLADGTYSLGSATFTFPLGKPLTVLTQNFDTVTAPAIPAGWATSVYSNATLWVTSAAARNTAPNAAFAAEADQPGVTELLSPTVAVTTPAALLSFRNYYNTEVDPLITNRAYDGGVLEIQIGNGSFTDILAAGGTFLAGGYTRAIDATNDNPLAGRQAWSGNSGGFIATTIGLPASAAGQNIRLKWRFGTDSGNYYGGAGWYIDSVAVSDGATCCQSLADLAVSQVATPNPAVQGSDLNYQVTISNVGPQSAFNVVVTDVLSPSVTLASAPPSAVYTNGTVIYSPGTIASGSSTSFTISVTPMSGLPVSNLVSVAGITADPTPGNNAAALLVPVSTAAPPAITQQPFDLAVIPGNEGAFQVAASGPPPLTYQWFFNSTTVSGANSNVLTLTNVQSVHQGPYLVVVSNPQGAVTSSVARLSLLLPPTVSLISSTASTTNISIAVGTVSGANYVLEYKDSLNDANWISLPPPKPGTGGSLLFQDTNGTRLPSRFYRVRAN
jgi:uncharacterized repeat protein (TIGR01451 family)